MDTIDVSNLNRQFLFRHADVGKYKAEVAAKFVEKRVKGVKITPYCGKIQDKDEEYYKQFAMIVCGLDSIEARRWINATLVGMVDENDEDSLKPLIDGGTEGFKGQARVVLPTMTSCIGCQLDMHAPRAAVPLCTLATIPRQPQHCIEWAHIIAWDEERKDITLDTDDPEHITWLFQKALKQGGSGYRPYLHIEQDNAAAGEGHSLAEPFSDPAKSLRDARADLFGLAAMKPA